MLAPLFLSLLPVLPAGEDPDLIVLADGTRIECRVLLESDEKVVYRTKNKLHEVAPGDVAEIQSVERSLRQYLERFAATDPKDVRALGELALFAESLNLPGEAHNTWIRILTLDGINEQAWTKLGGVKRRDGWELKVRGRYYTIDELRERAGDWKNALELRTAHFLIQTDGTPERALDVAIDVERACMTFYDVLGKPLDLYVFDEVPEIHIFADAKDYPAPPKPGDVAWFNLPANTLYVDASTRPSPGPVVAEFTQALIFNAFRRTLGKTGEIEPWAREGLAQGFAAAVLPDPGRVRFDFSWPYLPHFKSQAEDPKPLSLEKVLRAGFASFDSGSDQARYVAQAYTLTHFLIFHAGGKHRAGYADFLRSSYLGKGGTTNFFAALGADEKTLEAEWTAYVEKVASG
jgi:hypothetical protein